MDQKCNLINVRPNFHDMTLISVPKCLYIPQISYVKCHRKSKIKAPPYLRVFEMLSMLW